jgi:hypothetical protein
MIAVADGGLRHLRYQHVEIFKPPLSEVR